MKVLTRWEDPAHQQLLVALPYDSGFGIMMSSRSRKTLAETALMESLRLDVVEAPQRELASRARQLAAEQAIDHKARALNKPGFRP